jgi:DNA-binding NarL/FixJ family response regulator
MPTTKVVLADDHEGIRQMLRLRLQFLNCEVVGEASDGLEAVTAVEQTEPHVVVMDLQMPKLDGVEATRIIKERWPRVRVLGYTALSDASRVDDLMAAGADGNFFKEDYLGLLDAVSGAVTS